MSRRLGLNEWWAVEYITGRNSLGWESGEIDSRTLSKVKLDSIHRFNRCGNHYETERRRGEVRCVRVEIRRVER